MEEAFELEIRRIIYDLVVKNPGLHARKIAEILSLRGQLADYHLAYLEKAGLITSTKEEGFRRYYAKGEIGTKDMKILSVLRRETPLRIVLFLLEHPGSLYKELYTQLNMLKSGLTYHLKRLEQYGIIEHTLENEIRYSLVNAQEIFDLLVKYKPYTRMARFNDTWVNLKWPKKRS